MKKITKRSIVTDQTGMPITGDSEHLNDDGNGRYNVMTRKQVTRCPNCHRPISDVSELRGQCDICRIRSVCSQCIATCRGCSKVLCGRCRKGFVNNSGTYTVCHSCRILFQHSQAYYNRLNMQRLRYERARIQLRERQHMRSLQLNAAKLRAMAKLQAIKIHSAGQMARLREHNKCQIALMRARQNARRNSR